MARALAWVAPLVTRLALAGVDVDAEPMPAADTHAIALRRKGVGPRAALVLEVEAPAIVAALELPVASPEIDVFRAQLAHAASAERIFGALALLPDPFAIGLYGEEPTAVSEIDVAALTALLGRAVDESKRLRVGWRVPRDTALEHAGLLDEQLEDTLAALAVPFALLAREDARPPRARLPASTRLFRPTLRTSRTTREPIEIELGSHVLVKSGPFEGKEGVVEELDGRGGARVRLGLLATRIGVAELSALEPVRKRKKASLVSGPSGAIGKAGTRRTAPRPAKPGTRPALGSSHRRR